MKRVKGLWEDNAKIYCNVCNKSVDKFVETLVVEDNVFCLHCNNWLCGVIDAWGEIN